jgi:hypothetical protein
MSKPTPAPKRFDPAILEAMQEPLFVRVERRAGGGSSPIELPAEEGMPNGGFSKDRIRGTSSSPSLESWLVNEWCGGGVYYFIVADSSQPDAKKMEWISSYDPRTYPVRPPPPMAGSAFTPMSNPMPLQQPMQPMAIPPPAPMPFVQPPAPQVSMSSSPWPSGFQYAPQPGVTQAAPQYAQPTPSPYYGAPVFVQQPQQQAPFTPFDRTAVMEKERLEREKQELQAKVAAAEKRESEERHQRELDRIRQDNERALAEFKASIAPKTDPAADARFAKLENTLDKLFDRLAAPAAPTGPSPEMLAMQRQIEESNRRNEELQREMQRQREKDEAERRAETERRDRERAEQNLREEMRRQEAGFKETIANLATMITKMEERPRGPDPMIQFMQESNKQNTEAMRDMMRQSQLALDNLRTMMMTPRDVLALAKEGQGGFDEMRRQITGTYGDVMGAYRQVLEMSMQMQPQGESPTIGVVKDGISQAKEFANRYFSNKSKEQIELMRAQRAVAEAQAHAAGAAVAAAGGVPPMNPNLVQQAAQEAASGGLGGAVITPPPVYVPEQNAHSPGGQLPPSNVIPITQGQPTVTNAQGTVTSPKRTDDQWFGPAIGEVQKLRDGVALFLTSIQEGEAGLDPKTKQPKGVSPEIAVDAVLQATAIIAQNNVPVPAFTELFMQERVADFVDVLLPAPVPQAYRDDVVKIIYERLKDDEDDEDEDEDEAEGAS